MEGVITPEGTATRAAIRGYNVAGKTGTVRKVDGDGYNSKRHKRYLSGLHQQSIRGW